MARRPARKPAGKGAVYRVVRGTSIRLSLDPRAPEYEQSLNFHPGMVLTADNYPPYTDVAELLACGAWEVMRDG